MHGRLLHRHPGAPDRCRLTYPKFLPRTLAYCNCLAIVAADGVTDYGEGGEGYMTSEPTEVCYVEGEMHGSVEKFTGFGLIIDTFKNTESLGAHRDDLLRAPGGPVDAAWSAPGGPLGAAASALQASCTDHLTNQQRAARLGGIMALVGACAAQKIDGDTKWRCCAALAAIVPTAPWLSTSARARPRWSASAAARSLSPSRPGSPSGARRM